MYYHVGVRFGHPLYEMFTMSSHGNLTGKLGGMTNYENQQGGTKSRMGRCLPAHHTMFLTAQRKEHRL